MASVVCFALSVRYHQNLFFERTLKKIKCNDLEPERGLAHQKKFPLALDNNLAKRNPKSSDAKTANLLQRVVLANLFYTMTTLQIAITQYLFCFSH